MSKFEYRFGIAAILLASMLSGLVAPAQAGGKCCVGGGDVRRGDTGTQVHDSISDGLVGSGYDFAGSRDRAKGLGKRGIVLAGCWPPPENSGPWHCIPR